jgi:hypothetical protein
VDATSAHLAQKFPRPHCAADEIRSLREVWGNPAARAVADLDIDGQGSGLEGEESRRFGRGADGPALVRKETEPILRRERKNSGLNKSKKSGD